MITAERKYLKKQRKIIKDTNAKGKIEINKSSAEIKDCKEIKSLRVVTLNINHLNNKLIELTELLYTDNPDIIQLQETHRTSMSARINWPGYDIIESHAKDERGFNGLITGIKRELYGQYTVDKMEDNCIEITLNDKEKEKLSLVNIYIPVDVKRKEYTDKAIRLLERNRRTIMIGDWNTDKRQMKEITDKKNCKIYTASHEATGSRRVQGQITERLIDYSISNNENIIESEKHLDNWHVSDHIPVETKIKWNNKGIKPETVLIIDRERLKEDKMKRKILNHKFKNNETDPQKIVDIFHEELMQLLTRQNIIRKKNEGEFEPNKKVKNLIEKRKTKTNIEDIKEISKEIKKEVKELKKKQFS
ncbi:hypothetical protein GINT2_002170 [Glugoides intestinalis]